MARIGLTSITVVVILLAIALSLVIAEATDDNFYLLVTFLFVVGLYVTSVGLGQRFGSGTHMRRADGNYMLFWGTLVLVLGILGIIDHLYPGNILWLVIGFIIWLALAVLLFSIRPKAKAQ
jgi:hypothetical protein